MGNPVPMPDGFATTMQQLSAEAAKSVPIGAHPRVMEPPRESPPSEPAETDAVGAQLANLTAKVDHLAVRLSPKNNRELAARFQKIDDQLAALRSTETVNQRLFDSLHDELLKYRDNFLHESLQKPFIHDLVHLYDHLSSLSGQLGSAAEKERNRGPITQWRDNLENAVHSLMEILHRFEVKEVEARENIDRSCHKVVSFEPADFPEEDGRIVMRVKRGFSWRGKLIRPEEVIAKRYG